METTNYLSHKLCIYNVFPFGNIDHEASLKIE